MTAGGRKPNRSAGVSEVTSDGLSSLSQRLDRWLWFARIVKSRTLAAALIEAGKFRVNAVKVLKPSATVKPGDVVTSAVQKDVRVFQVKALGIRRGPATEAQLLYEDLTPKPASLSQSETAPHDARDVGRRDAGTGRPTKRDRRLIERLHGRD